MRDTNIHPVKSTDLLPVSQSTVTRSSLKSDYRAHPTNARTSQDEIARKAFFMYLDHGCHHGQDVQDWLKAEAQVIAARNPGRAQL